MGIPGHARDLAQVNKEVAQTRRHLLKSVLHARSDREFPNLERIASRGVDTYNAEQLAFGIELILEGAEKKLHDSRRP